MNETIVIGNLVRDPELKSFESGTSVCTFTVASDRRYKVDGEKRTDYYRVDVWGKQAESCKAFLAKGKKVYVNGELQPLEFMKKDGTKGFSLNLRADNVVFLSPKGTTEDTLPEGFEDLAKDDIPF